MSKIHGVNSAAGLNPVQASLSPKTPKAPAPAPTGDTVEISPQARLASLLASVPPMRMDLVNRVKAEIQSGTYDTPEKLDKAFDKLMDELGF